MKSNKKKKPSWGLNPKINKKNRTSLLECDYLKKLNKEEKEWLSKFNREYVNASFSEKERHLHSKKQELEIYKDNNRRNKCLHSKVENTNSLVDLKEIPDNGYENKDIETMVDEYLTEEYLKKLHSGNKKTKKNSK